MSPQTLLTPKFRSNTKEIESTKKTICDNTYVLEPVYPRLLLTMHSNFGCV